MICSVNSTYFVFKNEHFTSDDGNGIITGVASVRFFRTFSRHMRSTRVMAGSDSSCCCSCSGCPYRISTIWIMWIIRVGVMTSVRFFLWISPGIWIMSDRSFFRMIIRIVPDGMVGFMGVIWCFCWVMWWFGWMMWTFWIVVWFRWIFRWIVWFLWIIRMTARWLGRMCRRWCMIHRNSAPWSIFPWSCNWKKCLLNQRSDLRLICF